ncbi:choline-phosphate cytidylyltransferase [Fusobacterium polymorphum]|uniref:Choline-phosphate cytidylyltransferase n=1 Tax=Fusobacterium nucleatum subsp. polymorphum TaxID=76857 RepID=A0A2B7YH15_FUSNP|nr:NTP transferase domain-containing protein [Fusobacterium polymorphum]PGH20172.1 choline-phosphate cytidylyltransferase [Fusobacterium polymorphum]
MKRNAIILAAGTSSRFVPISFEIPKSLLKVRGEVLIERQINQLQEAGILDITVVVGYKKELFYYLENKYNVSIVENEDYHIYNNTSSLIKVLDKLENTYICSSDNYFTKNVFLENEEQAYYSAIYINGETDEYCIQYDKEDIITKVTIGGENSYIMLGHVYFDKNFSDSFKEILKSEYENEETRKKLWEQIYIKYISTLKMKIKKYTEGIIFEFDSLEELRKFEPSFQSNTKIMKEITRYFQCNENELSNFLLEENKENNFSFSFIFQNKKYMYSLKIKEKEHSIKLYNS